ncbi:hypothetical protein [Nocardia sp. IFM 10818]
MNDHTVIQKTGARTYYTPSHSLRGAREILGRSVNLAERFGMTLVRRTGDTAELVDRNGQITKLDIAPGWLTTDAEHDSATQTREQEGQ